jgi:ribosome maturation factor RimP
VEVHLFKAVDGQKVFTGILSDFDAQDMVLTTIAGEEKRFARKAASLVKPVVDMEGVEDVDLGEE